MNRVNDARLHDQAPELDTWYPLELGESLNDDSSSQYYTIRYEFKPASIDTSRPGVMRKRLDTNEVIVELPNNQNGKDNVVFNGHQEPYKEDQDAILIFDGKTFRLERLHHAIKLRHVRKADLEVERVGESGVTSTGDRKTNENFEDAAIDFQEKEKYNANNAYSKNNYNPPAKKRFSGSTTEDKNHTANGSSTHSSKNKSSNIMQGSSQKSNAVENIFMDSPPKEDKADEAAQDEEGEDIEVDVGMEIEEALNNNQVEEEEINICDDDNEMDEFVEEYVEEIDENKGRDPTASANAVERSSRREKDENMESDDDNDNDVEKIVVAAGLKSSSESESGSSSGSDSGNDSENESGSASDDNESQSSGDEIDV